MKYKYINNIVIRIPIFSNNDNREILTNEEFLESIYIASPSLYDEIIKKKKCAISEKERKKNFEYSIYKYYSRMKQRCTPFGLFSGCTTAVIDKKNNLELSDINCFRRHTRLDMNYLCSLIRYIVQDNSIKPYLIYKPNSSLYKVGNKYRYVEYKFYDKIKKFEITSIETDKFLDIAINNSISGIGYF